MKIIILISIVSMFQISVYSQDSSRSLVIVSMQKNKFEPLRPAISSKDPGKAFWLALGSTLIPTGLGSYLAYKGDNNGTASVQGIGIGMAVAGVLVGPSVGNFYAGDSRRGVNGILLRGGGALLSLIGATMVMESIDWNCEEDCSDNNTGGADVLFLYSGLVLISGSAIWNIVTAPTSAKEFNRRSVTFSPFINPRSRTAGINVGYQF